MRTGYYYGILDVEVMKVTLRELRKKSGMTQVECAKYLGVPIRTYQNYETDESKASSIKYMYMAEKLEKYGYVDETHGILTQKQIRDKCSAIFADFDVEYCYLFGSYARGEADEESDVDLLISTSLSGISFFDLVESIREGLKKKVDVLNSKQIYDNPKLLEEILQDGVKIYG